MKNRGIRKEWNKREIEKKGEFWKIWKLGRIMTKGNNMRNSATLQQTSCSPASPGIPGFWEHRKLENLQKKARFRGIMKSNLMQIWVILGIQRSAHV